MNLNQITMPSTDLVRSVAFYKLLGLRLIVDSTPRYARFECPAGDATLSLHHVDEIAKGNGIIVYFECEELDEQFRALEAKGVKFDLQPVDQKWLWREAHVCDPDGNRLILFHAGSHRKNPPWRIDS